MNSPPDFEIGDGLEYNGLRGIVVEDDSDLFLLNDLDNLGIGAVDDHCNLDPVWSELGRLDLEAQLEVELGKKESENISLKYIIASMVY